jgi:hypothetical protein
MRIVLATVCFAAALVLLAWLGLITYAFATEPGLQGINPFERQNLPSFLLLVGAFFVAVFFAVAGLDVVSGKPRNRN